MKNFASHLTVRNGLFLAAGISAIVACCNGTGVASYSAAPPDGQADVAVVASGLIQTALPGLLSLILATVAKFLGVDPEYVAAVKDFAKNPTVQEIERRMINSAVASILPRLGKYPEFVFPLLKAIADAYASNSEVSQNVSALSQSVSKAIIGGSDKS